MIFHWFSKKYNNKNKTTYKRTSRKEAADELVRYAEDMTNANRLDEALKHIDNALQIDPQNDFAWGDRGLILDKQDRIEESLASFSKAIEINPNNPITWLNKGLTLLKNNRLKESIECFDMAIENRQDYAKAWYNKGRALSILGEINSSQTCFDKARKLDPFLYSKLKRMK
jgi:tetratricopeptide (TPR) repeat protein